MTCLAVNHRMHSEKLFDSLEGPGFDSPHLHQMKKIYDVAIIGAGIVGMSTALKLQEKGKNVLVLDKEKSAAVHQSGRNSGVIHSGIYYKPQSFKSDLCIRGRELLIDFMNTESIPYRIEGKIVVDNLSLIHI